MKLVENMEKIKNILLYAGMDKEKNAKYKDFVLKQDVRNLRNYLMIAGALYLILGIASAASSGFAHSNTILYFITALIFGVIFILRKLTMTRFGSESNVNRIFIFMFVAVLYFQSIHLTVMHSDQPSVTFFCLLLILPLLFAERPLPMIIFQTGFVAIFCAAVLHHKPYEIAIIDIWNAITYLVVSVIVIILITPMRLNQIVQPEIIREISEKDLLTGLKNRNSFENFCADARQRKTPIICIYADANGLHELNNKLGHMKGDEMLKDVADVMMKHFGNDIVFRIGGDEFVAFSYEDDADQIERHMQKAKEELLEMGHHLSIGSSGPGAASDRIEQIIRNAEISMYRDKKSYYSHADRDRRGR